MANCVKCGTPLEPGDGGVLSGSVDGLAPLVEVGGRHAEFLPVGTFSRRWHPNLRNHRKIAIIDGKIGFTGGVNIGDEYTGRKRRVGPWRDTHLRICGPAVLHLQEVFTDLGYTEGDLPVSETAQRETFAIPPFPEVEREQQEEVVSVIKAVI